MRNEEIDKLRFQGYGYKKIARLLRLSENTIKSYCRRHPFDKTQKVCLQCGKPIENTPHKREKKFCSDECRLDWWNSHPELINRKQYTIMFVSTAVNLFRAIMRIANTALGIVMPMPDGRR